MHYAYNLVTILYKHGVIKDKILECKVYYVIRFMNYKRNSLRTND